MTSMDEKENAGKKTKNWMTWTAAIILLSVHFLVLYFSALQKSATSDEPYHIARGVSALFSSDARLPPEARTGGIRGAFSRDFRMSVAHPPLINLICALPLLALDDLKVPFRDPVWLSGDYDPALRKFRFHQALLWTGKIRGWEGNEDPLKIILLCRIPVMIMSVVLGFLVFLASRSLYGGRGALASLALYSFSPAVIAHARLATTDLGCALFTFIFALALCRLMERGDWKSLLLAGLSFGLAQLAKYSSIILIPMIPAVMILCTRERPSAALRSFFETNPGKKEFRTGFFAWIMILVMGAFIIWAGYGFEIDSIHEIPEPGEASLVGFGLYLKTGLCRLMRAVPIPPRTYYFGLARTLLDTSSHYHELYFMGHTSSSGWWYYYPVLFLMKEPLPFLPLILISVISRAKTRLGSWRTLPMVFLVMGAGYLFFFMFFNQKNIGIRHVLPIYPFIFVWTGGLFQNGNKGKIWRYSTLGLLALYAAASLSAFPDYLVYFNSLVGGPDGGLKYSVVGEDWGQDMPALARFQARKKIKTIHYDPYGNSSPGRYGISSEPVDCSDLKPGWYAFHAVKLARPLLEDDAGCYDFFRKRKPEAVLAHTIFVYRLDENDVFPDSERDMKDSAEGTLK